MNRKHFLCMFVCEYACLFVYISVCVCVLVLICVCVCWCVYVCPPSLGFCIAFRHFLLLIPFFFPLSPYSFSFLLSESFPFLSVSISIPTVGQGNGGRKGLQDIELRKRCSNKKRKRESRKRDRVRVK